jgi:hypothetical protein
MGTKVQYHLMPPIPNSLNFSRNNLQVFLYTIHSREMQHEDGTLCQACNCLAHKHILFGQIQKLKKVFAR